MLFYVTCKNVAFEKILFETIDDEESLTRYQILPPRIHLNSFDICPAGPLNLLKLVERVVLKMVL